jgi:hypothetical protein
MLASLRSILTIFQMVRLLHHDHGAFDLHYNIEQFSQMGCNGGQLCDIGIGIFLNQGQYEVNAEWKLFLEDWAGGYTASPLTQHSAPSPPHLTGLPPAAKGPSVVAQAPSPDAVRRNIQSKIAAFIKTGNDLRDGWTKRLGDTEHVQRQSAIAISGWHKSVEDYLTTIPRADVTLRDSRAA